MEKPILITDLICLVIYQKEICNLGSETYFLFNPLKSRKISGTSNAPKIGYREENCALKSGYPEENVALKNGYRKRIVH